MAAVLLLLAATRSPLQAGVAYPGPAPGRAVGESDGDDLILSNAALACRWSFAGGALRLVEARQLDPETTIGGGELAVFVLADGRRVPFSAMPCTIPPVLEELEGDPQAPRLAEHAAGVAFSAGMEDPEGLFRVAWRAELRDGANVVRQSFLIDVGREAGDTPVRFKEIALLDITMPGATASGVVAGSPVVGGTVFAALEHPLAEHRIDGDRVTGVLGGEHRVRPGVSLELSSVFGVVPPGQLRRGFLYYLERERAHPYRQSLHYNSWYDLGIEREGDKRMTETECLERIRKIDEELRRKRNLSLDAFLWDDGWDDLEELWQFSGGFPQGFKPLREAARPSGAAMGVWLSPLGGYGESRARRVEKAAAEGLEVTAAGLSLAGPHTYERFRQVCLEMMAEQGVRLFKFDGIGAGATAAGAPAETAADVDALIRLSRELRFEDPGLFINVTVGSWPSPYWLWCADSIWRGGADCDFAGQGNKRQRWITYRDSQVYRNVVRRAPLFPMNSVMMHGLLIGDRGAPASMRPKESDVTAEIRTLFGSGTDLQELYITPDLVSAGVWDEIARTAVWARSNMDLLVDSHWVGGDPAEGALYGFASWAAHKGILVLRNPTAKSQPFEICLEDLFELPGGAPQRYRILSPFEERKDLAGEAKTAAAHWDLKIKRYEVVVLEALPEEG